MPFGVGKGFILSSPQAVEIVSVIRRMRGGSQSFLVQGRDKAVYVAKFANNPQGNRTLINEYIANQLLTVLGVTTPDLAILRLSDSCQGREELYFSGTCQMPIAPGLHLGSKFPADPNKVPIFDFLPRNFLARVSNLDDVGVVFAFDQWTAHVDKRQFIFVRQPRPAHDSIAISDQHWTQRESSLFTAWAIDNGMCFGKDWLLAPKKLYGSSPLVNIYSYCDLERSAVRGAKLIQSLPPSLFQAAAYRDLPHDWFGPGEERALQVMLSELSDHRAGLEAAIQEQVEAVRYPKKLAS